MVTSVCESYRRGGDTARADAAATNGAARARRGMRRAQARVWRARARSAKGDGVSMSPALPTGVVVLHWGAAADTLACLGSIAASRFPGRPLLVVDNGTGSLAAADVEAAAAGAQL